MFKVNRGITMFQIEKTKIGYLLRINQNLIQKNLWESSVLLGLIENIEELEEAFRVTTRGEFLI